jgi:GT2 family glycosyltransferase/glycosyltransferase involved in cell wall biosynthesis
MRFTSIFGFNRKLRGRVDGVSDGWLFGWAVTRADPLKAARLRVVVNGASAGEVDAQMLRPDSKHAVASGGKCGFLFDLRARLVDLPAEVEVLDAESGQPLDGSPLLVSAQGGTGMLDRIDALLLKGWAVSGAPGSGAAVVEILADGVVVGEVVADRPRPDLRSMGLPDQRHGFEATLPGVLMDGQERAIGARVKGSTRALRGKELPFQALIKGHIDHCSPESISGWAVNLCDEESSLWLDIFVDDKLAATTRASLPRADVASSLGLIESVAAFGFSQSLPPPPDARWNLRRVRVAVAGSSHVVAQHLMFRTDFVVGVLEDIAAQELATPDAPGEAGEIGLARRIALRQTIAQLRERSADGQIGIDLGSHAFATQARPAPAQSKVDVIVPVYKGFDETLACINSVLQTRDAHDFELIVINDAGPDRRLAGALEELAARHGFTLLENRRNIGFVGTVNRGMRQHPGRDVVLLNSDTVVCAGWLDGLRRAAYSAKGIGTATPLSNRATICSLPRTCHDNEMPMGLSAQQMNDLCAQANPGVVVDIPTAIGFAMYIRRETLDEVGLFNEELWGKGYGEENDFCVRASALGWRHVAACDVFVLHHGSVSFEAGKDARVRKNLAKLNQLYPDYAGKIERFLRDDPLALPRAKVNVSLLRRIAPSWVLFITHGMGGGTQKAIGGLCAELQAKGGHALVLRSTPGGKVELVPVYSQWEETLLTEFPAETSALALSEVLAPLGIERVHVHHAIGFGVDIWRLPGLLGVPYDVMVHDFHLACPRINLIDDSGFFCGQPDLEACERCVTATSLDHGVELALAQAGGSVAAWRSVNAANLLGARQVVAPSLDTVQRMQPYFPQVQIQALPHPEAAFTFTPRRRKGTKQHRVAILGAIGPHKGVDLLLSCARHARRRGLPVQFVVIGYTSCDDAFEDLANVEISGKYSEAELPALVEASGCSCALFLNVWPETFSYTLSEAWRLGLFPIVPDLGAPSDRVRESGIGAVIPSTRDPQIIMAEVMALLERRS